MRAGRDGTGAGREGERELGGGRSGTATGLQVRQKLKKDKIKSPNKNKCYRIQCIIFCSQYS